MDANGSYLIDVLFIAIGLFFIVYVIYGRIKGKSLVGGYKPGKPGYDVFLRLLSTKYLVISIIATLFFVTNAVFDVRSILEESSSRSILIVAPVAVIATFFLVFPILSVMFKKK